MRPFHAITKSGLALLVALLAACSPLAPEAAPTQELAAPTAAPAPLPAPSATALPAPSATLLPTLAPSATPAPAPQPSPSASAVPLTPTPTLAAIPEEQRAAIFDEVWRLVRDRYLYPDYRGVDWSAAQRDYRPRALAAATPAQFYQVMHDLIAQLGDDHSRFETPQQVAEEALSAQGELSYVGIGVNVREDAEGGLITRLAHGGPAEQAGLQPRDLIVAVGGVPFTDTAAFGPGGPNSAIRGVPGSVVQLTVRSAGAAPRQVLVTRQVIPSDAFPPVEAQRLAGTQVGLLTINTFLRDGLDQLVRDQLEALLQGGALSGLIIDLRDNSGGFRDAMLDTIGIFVNGGSIGSTRSRTMRQQLRIPSGKTLPALRGVPIVLLTGQETVSAAEMFAAGMRVRGRARIVGSPSAGNTENLLAHNLPDGSRLWLAEYAYRLPDGSLLEGKGVIPDRSVNAEWWRFAPADDPQIQAALAEL